jgi:putative transposase
MNTKVLKAYKFRIYPMKAQKTKMERILNPCRWVYNGTLAYRKNAWVKDQKSIPKSSRRGLTWP